MEENPNIWNNKSDNELKDISYLNYKLQNSKISEKELSENLSLYLTRQHLTHLLFIDEIYRMILNKPGYIMEFGVRWGRNIATSINLRGIYEPYNHQRRIIGFDTFEGFVNSTNYDRNNNAGDYSIDTNHKHDLDEILNIHESNSPINHISKHDLIKGNVIETLPEYFKEHGDKLVALAYIDLDLYEPIKSVLDNISDKIVQGGVIVIDDINSEYFPGAYKAYNEWILTNIDYYEVRKSPFHQTAFYMVKQ